MSAKNSISILPTAWLVCTCTGVLISMLGGCSHPSATPSRHSLTPEQQTQLDEYKAEVEIGRNMAARLLQFYGTLDGEEILTYVNQVGNYVASFSDAPDRRYMFAILNHDSINAFACPGGYILVTLGTLRASRNEAELAMVLGHEIAHVGKKHMYNTLKHMSKEERESNEKALDTYTPGIVAAEMRRRPDPENKSEVATLLARYMTGAQSSLVILQAAKAGMNVILEKGLDKTFEFEADQEGVKYAIRAGYHPDGLSAFFKRMEENRKKNSIDTTILDKTHPTTPERMSKVAEVLVQLEAKNIIGAQGKDRFERIWSMLPPVKISKKKAS